MAVEVELGQRADVDAVFQLAGDLLAERVVQPVDALDDEHLIFVHLEPHALLEPALRLEGIERQLDLAPGQQLDELIVEQRHVDGFQTLEVGLTVRAEGDILAVLIVVIQRNRQRALAADAKLHTQAVGKRRLAAGTRPGNEHDPRAVSDNALGNLRDGALLHGLADADERPCFALGDDIVQIGGVFALQNLRAGVRLDIGAHELGALDKRRGRTGKVLVRQQQHHAGVIKPQGEGLDFARRFHHVAIEILAQPVAGIHVEIIKRAIGQQAHGVLLPLRAEIRHRLLARPAGFDDGQVRAGNLMHARLDSAHQRRGERNAAHVQIDAPADAMLKARLCARRDIPQSKQQNQPRAALVNAAVFFIFSVQMVHMLPPCGQRAKSARLFCIFHCIMRTSV